MSLCEGGLLVIEGGGQKLVAYSPDRKVIKVFHREHKQYGIGWSKGDHYVFRNWLEAIRSRRHTELAADILEGHISSSLCHTGMISHRLGQATSGVEIRRSLGNSLAEKCFESMQDHLGRNDIDVAESVVTLGQWLEFDPQTERFRDNDAANAMLSRRYRKSYVVPENV